MVKNLDSLDKKIVVKINTVTVIHNIKIGEALNYLKNLYRKQ